MTEIFDPPEGAENIVLGAIRALEANRTPVRLEIEHANIHFYSVLTVRRSQIVVSKPPALKKGIRQGGTVRFTMPDKDEKVVQMEVLTPHIDMEDGLFCFSCQIPVVYTEKSGRMADRFSTARFNNIQLILPDKETVFRVIDISTIGLKIFTGGLDFQGIFEIGTPVEGASVTIGQNLTLDLEQVIPRSHHGKTVGMEILVAEESTVEKILQRFIESLETTEMEQMSAAPPERASPPE